MPNCRFRLSLEAFKRVRLQRQPVNLVSNGQALKQSALLAAIKYTSFWEFRLHLKVNFLCVKFYRSRKKPEANYKVLNHMRLLMWL